LPAIDRRATHAAQAAETDKRRGRNGPPNGEVRSGNETAIPYRTVASIPLSAVFRRQENQSWHLFIK
jgi:hypothetical protein